jgi:hypothetical protein
LRFLGLDQIKLTYFYSEPQFSTYDVGGGKTWPSGWFRGWLKGTDCLSPRRLGANHVPCDSKTRYAEGRAE